MKTHNALTTLDPHPDHFDASKYDANGNPIKKRRSSGSRSKLAPEDCDQALLLADRVVAARAELDSFFRARGILLRTQQDLLTQLRKGWRPVR